MGCVVNVSYVEIPKRESVKIVRYVRGGMIFRTMQPSITLLGSYNMAEGIIRLALLFFSLENGNGIDILMRGGSTVQLPRV